jgi:hypothetical protein
MKSSALAIGLTLAFAAHGGPPTLEEVGDPDSFGRGVVYLGLAQTASVLLNEDCTPQPWTPPNARCIVLNPQPLATSFEEDGLDTIDLPAGASKSLLCFTLTPFSGVQFHNLTGVKQNMARFFARAKITIENEVLRDPALIDPTTGQPYGGQMTLQMSTFHETRSIEPGELEQKNLFMSRDCIGGLVSRRSLVGSGLSEAQAAEFFSKPMKLTFGATGTVQIVDVVSFMYGIRLYGDR